MKHIFLALSVVFSLAADHFVSFIIPCYNCEAWVGQAVESIYRQQLSCSFEIVCTDDGSTDNTFGVLTELSQKYPEMRILRHGNNRGGGAARNTCVLNSRGDLIFCLDADNALEKETVPVLMSRIEEYDIVAFGKVQYFIGNFEKVGYSTYVYPGVDVFTVKDIVQHGDTPAWSGNYLYTRASYDKAGGYPEQWGALDTFTFGFHQVLSGSRMTVIPGLYYWHRHGIEGYYTREAIAQRLNIHFFQFILSHQELFTEDSMHKIRHQLRLAQSRREFYDLQWVMGNHILELKPQM